MAKTCSVTLMWTLAGDESGGLPGVVTFQNTNSPGEMILAPLTVGRNNIFLPGPPTPTIIVLIPPTASTNAKTWDSGGATGGALHPSQPSMISVPAGTTSINIGSAGSEVVKVYFL